jgi:uncharacterized protein YbjT (DUF2867 family)
MSQIAIMGATGFVGSALSLRLLDEGHSLIVLSRHPKNWPIQHKELKVVKGDLMTYPLEEILKEVDCAYYLVHGLAENESDFEYIEAKTAARFTQAANNVKLKKIIYLGGLGPEDDLSHHLRSRHLVGSILGLGHVNCIEFRASVVLGAGSTSFEMIKALVNRLPVRPVVTWLENPCQPIGVDDLVQYLVAALEVQIQGHTIIEVGTQEVVAYGDLLDLMARLENLNRPKFLLPPMEQKLFLPLIDMILPEFSQVAKKLFLSLIHPTVVSDAKAEEIFPEIKPQALEHVMHQALKNSKTTYPAVWEGDFWKEIGEVTMDQTKMSKDLIVEKIKNLGQKYQKKLIEKIPGRKK